VNCSGPERRIGNHSSFDVAVYARVYEVRQMRDLAWLEPRWQVLRSHVKVDKVYLEIHRDLRVADEPTKLRDLLSDQSIAGEPRPPASGEPGERVAYSIPLAPHSYRVFHAR
jgi:hypothetical protein